MDALLPPTTKPLSEGYYSNYVPRLMCVSAVNMSKNIHSFGCRVVWWFLALKPLARLLVTILRQPIRY